MKAMTFLALECKFTQKEAGQLFGVEPEEFTKAEKELVEAEACFVKKVKESLG